MKNALNNQVGMLGDMFLWLGKLEARGHLLHKTGTPPKHFSRESNIHLNLRSCNAFLKIGR